MANQLPPEIPVRNKFIAVGILLGLAVGAALGLTVFDNAAIGISIGVVAGAALGALAANSPKKR